jgi:cadmium resistance transport/sequestration family protein
MIETILAAVISFVSTNVDDIFILIALFTQVSKSLTPRDIYYGQFIGIGVLIVLSLVGAWMGTIIPKEYIGLLGFFPIYMGIKKIYLALSKTDQLVEPVIVETFDKTRFFDLRFRFQILGVAAITIANGGDNIGIYIPFFTTLSFQHIMLTVSIFFILTYAWLTFAHYLVYHPSRAALLKKYQPVIFPIILIALGTYILLKNYTYTLFLF